MRILVLMVFCLGQAVCFAAGRTLITSDLNGMWIPSRPLNASISPPKKMHATEISLNVESFERVVLTRTYSDGEVESLLSTKAENLGSLFLWQFLRDDGFHYELVLGGWVLDSGAKKLFGTLYLHSKEIGLFNGWPISVEFMNSTKN